MRGNEAGIRCRPAQDRATIAHSKTILLTSPEATEALGELLGQRLQADSALALTGDLGAGKTCLARGVALGLAVDDPAAVCSPTYLLVMEHPGPIPMLHMDAYLPAKTQGFLEDGGVDYLAESHAVVVLEWADRLPGLLPLATLWIELRPVVWQQKPAREAILSDRDSGHFAWLAELPEKI